MTRLSYLAVFALGVAGQLCNLQASCGGCVATSGCVWKADACWTASTVPMCAMDADCYAAGSVCPIAASASVLYTQPATTVYASAPLYTSSAPVYSYPSTYSYPSSYVPYAYPVSTTPLYTAPAPIYTSYPVYNSYPVYYPGNNNDLFNYNGNVLGSSVRNTFYANALDPIIPGIGGAVSVANNYNLLANSPRIIDNFVGGYGYNRDPFRTYARNGFYANALGNFVPGLRGSLNSLNQYYLYSSLL